jgi:hypothetical protein
MRRLTDATGLLVCRRIAYHIGRQAHRDWPWRDPGEGSHARSCPVEHGPL